MSTSTQCSCWGDWGQGILLGTTLVRTRGVAGVCDVVLRAGLRGEAAGSAVPEAVTWRVLDGLIAAVMLLLAGGLVVGGLGSF